MVGVHQVQEEIHDLPVEAAVEDLDPIPEIPPGLVPGLVQGLVLGNPEERAVVVVVLVVVLGRSK